MEVRREPEQLPAECVGRGLRQPTSAGVLRRKARPVGGHDGADGSKIYASGSGPSLHVYPAAAGKSAATLATWYVDDIERVIDDLTARGVSFARYDGIEADKRGIAPGTGGGKVAWFTDLDGNTFAIEAD
jgi:hypothetical protein